MSSAQLVSDAELSDPKGVERIDDETAEEKEVLKQLEDSYHLYLGNADSFWKSAPKHILDVRKKTLQPAKLNKNQKKKAARKKKKQLKNDNKW